MYRAGKGGLTPDGGEAVRLSRKACDGGDARGCRGLGYLYGHGEGGLMQAKVEAVRLYRKACDGGHEPSCGRAIDH